MWLAFRHLVMGPRSRSSGKRIVWRSLAGAYCTSPSTIAPLSKRRKSPRIVETKQLCTLHSSTQASTSTNTAQHKRHFAPSFRSVVLLGERIVLQYVANGPPSRVACEACLLSHDVSFPALALLRSASRQAIFWQVYGLPVGCGIKTSYIPVWRIYVRPSS